MNKTRGFTLIELMLSMAYLSVLLVMIGMLTMQITNIYAKGITMRAVNQSGADIANDLTTTLDQASPNQQVKLVIVNQSANGGNGLGARLCTGKFTYVWNYGTTINANSTSQSGANTYSTGSNVYDIRFVKVPDSGNTLCVTSANGPDSGYPAVNRDQSVELLPEGDRHLALSAFTCEIVTGCAGVSLPGNQAIFTVSLTIGTDNQADIQSDGQGGVQCKPPSNGNNNYCAVNTFTFTARAANGSGGGS